MDKLLLEYPWLPKVVEASQEYGVDWLRISAMILLASGGDPRLRNIDYDFIYKYLGPDSPLYAMHWFDDLPNIEVIDRGTKWGLLQIHGLTAIDYGFKGRLINLTDIGVNIKVGCKIFITLVEQGKTVVEATDIFGFDRGFNNKNVEELMEQLRESIVLLSNIENNEDVHESLGH